ncbi:MAG: TIGR00159 family protein [Phycisphaerae bacterium]|jgi:diadenylate cyclase
MIQHVLDYVVSLFQSPAYRPWTILIEMSLIGVVVYAVLRFLHGTRGANLLQGLVILLITGFLVVKVLADWFGLDRLAVLYQPFVWTALLTTLVVFQPELRRGLMRIGEARFRRARQSELDETTRTIAAACAQLSKNKIGALIAIEREIGLSGLAEQGVRLDALVSVELLNTIFWPGSALHDLGVLIQGGRVAAAGCPFPLGDTEEVDRSLGSRHRAALGLSLESDALVVVVSEETGTISIAERGRLERHIPAEALAGQLRRRLAHTRGGDLPPPPSSESRGQEPEPTELGLPPLSATVPERSRPKKPAEAAPV